MRSLRQVFAAPIVLGSISLVGLLSALLADGLWDGLSWLALGAVVAVAVRYSCWASARVPSAPARGAVEPHEG